MALRVVVTGGSGKAGRGVVADLVEHGYDVVNVDIAASRRSDRRALAADVTDLGQVLEALHGAWAVVHLAAIPAARMRTDGETFRVNTIGTYNVFHAAARLGLGKVVWASSETLMGVRFEREEPRYAPIDEEHPRLPESSYALSKLAGEVMAEEFHRWSGIPFVGLRYSSIKEPEDYSRFPSFWDDPTTRAWNLWGYVDVEDVGQATRLALEADIQGVENFLVAAADTCMRTPSVDLLHAVYPDVPLRREIGEYETLLSIDKARAMLGYEPAHSWRDRLDA